MSRITAASRLGRAICELAIRSGSQMPFAVMPAPIGINAFSSAKDVARALGYAVLDTSLPMDHPSVTSAGCGRMASERLSHLNGPTLIILHATTYDGGDMHREIVQGMARLAAESWSVNGETHLLVVTPEDPVPLARLIGETLSRHDWAGSIPL